LAAALPLPGFDGVPGGVNRLDVSDAGALCRGLAAGAGSVAFGAGLPLGLSNEGFPEDLMPGFAFGFAPLFAAGLPSVFLP
jgi:hypothetical protein